MVDGAAHAGAGRRPRRRHGRHPGLGRPAAAPRLEADRRPALGQGRRRGGQPGQERVPGQRQPRDPDADERRARDDRAGPRERGHARAARVPDDGPHLGAVPGDADQRDPRLLEDRSGQDADRLGRLPDLRGDHRDGAAAGAAGGGEGARVRLRRVAGAARAADRRRRAARPDHHQPDRQRGEVHARGLGRGARRHRRAARRRRRAARARRRHRHRHRRARSSRRSSTRSRRRTDRSRGSSAAPASGCRSRHAW